MTATEFVVIGYVLIEGTAKTDYMHSSVPNLVFSPTTCVCTIHPSPKAVTWMGDASDYLKDLELSDDRLVEYRAEVDFLFSNHQWGFDSMFVNLDIARAFREKWFINKENIKLFEISILRYHLSRFREVVAPPEKNAAHNGSYFAAMLPEISKLELNVGYEIIGVAAWSDVHTSVCYDVREGFMKDMDATFNRIGFFERLATAELAAEANNQMDGGPVGDAYWFPVKISISASDAF